MRLFDLDAHLEEARELLAKMKQGDSDAWAEFEALARGCLARNVACQADMTLIVQGAAAGVPCCASCARGEGCESE